MENQEVGQEDQRTPAEIAKDRWGVEDLSDDMAVRVKMSELINSGIEGQREADELNNLWQENKNAKKAA